MNPVAGTRHDAPTPRSPSRPAPAHGRLLAGDVGELVGVSGTTIGQWARRGYIRASQSAAVPHVYAVEDVAEASVVADLLARGVPRRELRRAIDHLAGFGPWPLSEAALATDGRRVYLREDGDLLALTDRGWQRIAVLPDVADVRLRLRRAAGG